MTLALTLIGLGGEHDPTSGAGAQVVVLTLTLH